jgi:hypothetical protein
LVVGTVAIAKLRIMLARRVEKLKPNFLSHYVDLQSFVTTTWVFFSKAQHA